MTCRLAGKDEMPTRAAIHSPAPAFQRQKALRRRGGILPKDTDRRSAVAECLTGAGRTLCCISIAFSALAIWLAGCAPSAGPPDTNDGVHALDTSTTSSTTPAPIAPREANPASLRVQAEGIEYRGSIYLDGLWLRARATMVNRTSHPITVEYSRCGFHLHARRHADRSNTPDWRSEFVDIACADPGYRRTIASGDSIPPVVTQWQLGDILGDSLPDGRYAFTGQLAFSNGSSPEFPVGTLHLALRRPPLSAQGIAGRMTFRAAMTRPACTKDQTVRVKVIGTLTHAASSVEHISAECPVVLLAYRTVRERDAAPRSGKPVWQSSRECQPGWRAELLRRGDTRVVEVGASAREILGDSLLPGRYYFAVVVQEARRRLFLAAGDAMLERMPE